MKKLVISFLFLTSCGNNTVHNNHTYNIILVETKFDSSIHCLQGGRLLKMFLDLNDNLEVDKNDKLVNTYLICDEEQPKEHHDNRR